MAGLKIDWVTPLALWTASAADRYIYLLVLYTHITNTRYNYSGLVPRRYRQHSHYFCCNTRTAHKIGDWRGTLMAQPHEHVVGATGSGKSTFTKRKIIDAIRAGFAVCYLDVHGHDTDDLLQYIPIKRRKDVVIFDPSQFAIPWNPLNTDKIYLASNTYLKSIKDAWEYDYPTPTLDSVLYNALVALSEARQGLFGLYLMLTSTEYRQHVIKDISNPVVKQFWQKFDRHPEKWQDEHTDSTYNKIQILMADPRIRAISGSQSTFDINDMVGDKILFIRLPQGEIGVDKSALLGSILLAQIHQACLSRHTTVPFHLYIDECHTFAPHTISEMLSGIRKFNVSVTIVHQYMRQLDQGLLDSARANCIEYVFRVSVDDEKLLPTVGTQLEPHALEPYQCWVFGDGKPHIEFTEPIPYPVLPKSRDRITANQRKYLERPATAEIETLMRKFS